MSVANREKQLAEAEEVLGDRLAGVGFAKGLFFGHYLQAIDCSPIPTWTADLRTGRAWPTCAVLPRADRPGGIDRQAEIPDSVVRGLG